MLVDLLSPANYIMINREAIKIFGLNTAVYCSELLTIYKKAVKKKAFFDNGFFKVDRKYITDQTSLDVEAQLTCDLNLKKINVIKIHDDDPNVIYFDIEIFSSLLASEDIKLLDNVAKKVSVKAKGVKASERKYIIQSLKDSIRCNNYDVLTSLRDWIDAVMADPKKYLSIQQVEIFKDKLEEYCQGDVNLALKIIKSATVHQYVDCQWAINAYEKDLSVKSSINKRSPLQLNINPQKTTNNSNLSSEVF